MAKEPWFKFYAADYLLDPAVDALPLEAQGVLLRIWCNCHIDGWCSKERAEIARKSRLSVEVISNHWSVLAPFFEERDGRLYSARMESEKRKSEIARQNGKKRGQQLSSANCSADSFADCSAQSQSQSQSQIQSQNLDPPLSQEQGFDRSLQKKEYSQSDFDQRDLRRYTNERKRVELKLSHGSRYEQTDEQIFEYICSEAGLSPKHMREVFARIEQEFHAAQCHG